MLLVPGLPPLVVKARCETFGGKGVAGSKWKMFLFATVNVYPKVLIYIIHPKFTYIFFHIIYIYIHLDNLGSARHCLCILVNVYVPS